MKKTINKLILTWFLFIYIITIFIIMKAYKAHDAWLIGDWLINYRSGFIRRGLLGEIFYHLSLTTGINPGVFVALLQGFLYFIFYLFSYFLIKELKSIYKFLPLIFSPVIFAFQINCFAGACRKEILLLSSLVFLSYLKIKDQKWFDKYITFYLYFYPILILSHEALAVFFPYVLLLISITNKNTFSRFNFKIIFAICINFTSFLFVIFFSKKSYNDIYIILKSLDYLGYHVSGGIFNYLYKPLGFGFQKVLFHVKNGYIPWYFISFILCLIALIPLRNQIFCAIDQIKKNKVLIFLVITILIGNIFLFLFAIDWGRWIYINFVIWFILLSVIDIKSAPFSNFNRKYMFHTIKNFFSKSIIFLFWLVYELIWYLPHCCHAYPFRDKDNIFDWNYLKILKFFIVKLVNFFKYNI